MLAGGGAMSTFTDFAGFDYAVVEDAYDPAAELSGELPTVHSEDYVEPPRTALEIGVAHGAPREVLIEYLGALGLDADADANLLLDFDPEDLTAARREFLVGVWRPHHSTRLRSLLGCAMWPPTSGRGRLASWTLASPGRWPRRGDPCRQRREHQHLTR